MTSNSSPRATASTRAKVGDVVIAIADFKPRASDELGFGKGDRILVIERDDEYGDGWFLGEHDTTSLTGLFPEVFTRKLPQPSVKIGATDESSSSGRTRPEDDKFIFPYTKAQVQSWTPNDVAAYFIVTGVENRDCEVLLDQEISGEELLAMDHQSFFLRQLELGTYESGLRLWGKIKLIQDRINEQASKSKVVDRKRTSATKLPSSGASKAQQTSTPDVRPESTPIRKRPRVQVNLESEPQLPKRSTKLYGNSESLNIRLPGSERARSPSNKPSSAASTTKDLSDDENNNEGLLEVEDMVTETGATEDLAGENSPKRHSLEAVIPPDDPVEELESESDEEPDEIDHVDGGNEIVESLVDAKESEDEDSVESPQSSSFDHDLQSQGTRPSTVPTSHPGIKGQMSPQVLTITEAEELATAEQVEDRVADPAGFHGYDGLADDDIEQQQSTTDDCDAETTYSVDTISDDPKLRYIRVFAEQLAEDIKQVSGNSDIEDMAAEYLDPVLREFSWKLHGESSNPFQWEASVIIHRKRKNIIELLVPRPANVDDKGTEGDGSTFSEEGEDDDVLSRVSFRKPLSMVMQWVGDVETSPLPPEDSGQPIDDYPAREDLGYDSHEYDMEEPQSSMVDKVEALPQLPHYEEFIRESDAYQWLLNKIRQHGRLTFDEPNAMMEIATKIRKQLQAQEPLRKMSSRKPPSLVTMTFSIDWNPVRFMHDEGFGDPVEDALLKVLCLTGSWNEAQAATVSDYMDQTWPRSGRALITLLQNLLSLPEGEECSYQIPERRSFQHKPGVGAVRPPSKVAKLTACIQPPSVCSISVTGGAYFVSEMSEQIGWLASALRPSLGNQSPVACTPRLKDLQVNIPGEGPQSMMVVGSCNLSFDLETVGSSASNPGLCWERLFYSPMLVRGYPILRRSQPNTGLEMSLANMAAIVGSNQLVQWDKRIVVKGFNMLLVATLAATDIIVWHLLISEEPEERISYVDNRLDTLDSEASKGISLRMLETKRHVIGWCSKATDLCGDASANKNIKTSGLRKPPASIVIDRLYIEAGADFVAGLNMSFNKKEKPFWLERENDYPSLLKWVGAQPIAFYDVSDRRAWLADGASALLHLVRVSLYLDENDPESTYDWVFDPTKLEDKWDGFTGRQAALRTLKSWDNLDLKVYVAGKGLGINGMPVTRYSTLEKRVEKILHSIEILIDRQVMSTSQDGIRISQTLDLRRDIIGFDILDVISPLGPIHPRVKHLDSWGHGWVDLIPSIGITTIFGRGFGELIRPDEPDILCHKWKSVPQGKDYMVASVSTLQMLYEKRLLRMEPGLNAGEITSKIAWTSPNHPFKACECLQNNAASAGNADCHVDPVQFLVAKRSWKPRLVLRSSTLVDLTTLDQRGAVVFGHVPILTRKSEGKYAFVQDEDSGGHSSAEGSTRGMLRPPVISSVGSESTRSGESTRLTVPSSTASNSASNSGEGQDGESSRDNSTREGKRRSRMWRVLKWAQK